MSSLPLDLLGLILGALARAFLDWLADRRASEAQFEAGRASARASLSEGNVLILKELDHDEDALRSAADDDLRERLRRYSPRDKP